MPAHRSGSAAYDRTVDRGTPLEVAAATRLPTEFGDFVLRAYSDDDSKPPHLALVQGVIDRAHAPLVRIHSECMTVEGAGVLVYLRQEGRGIGLLNKLHAYRLQDAGLDTVDANLHLGFGVDQRDYRVAVAILEDLGVRAVRLLTNNPAKVKAFEGSAIRMVARVPLVVPPTDHNRSYLAVKRLRMGHLLEEASE
jgi:3,4-dihydroxy 2-butanone 4-phosphate synthase/GTP cyclohydrolase II